MFTGIVEQIGVIKSLQKGVHSAVLTVEAEELMDDLHIGDSVAVNGVCLTVTAFSQGSFQADVMHETFNRSSLAGLRPGSHVNLEQTIERAGTKAGNKGYDCALGAIEMVNMIRTIEA